MTLCPSSLPPQDTLKAINIKRHLCLSWAIKQVYSGYIAQGKNRSFLIMTALNVSCCHLLYPNSSPLRNQTNGNAILLKRQRKLAGQQQLIHPPRDRINQQGHSNSLSVFVNLSANSTTITDNRWQHCGQIYLCT